MNNKYIEELSLNHWPSLSTLLYGGWLLRLANGFTKRANSIHPLYHSAGETARKITECEKLYAANGLPAVFKITPFIHPAELDSTLDQAGYSVVDVTSVQTVDLAHIRKPRLTSVQIYECPHDEWLNDYYKLNQVKAADRITMERMLSNIKTRRGFISLYDDEQVVACGLGVVEREYIGLYDIVTDARYRNRGFGEQMILNLLSWGKDHGARFSYLAVIANNAPALRLYSKIGYTENYKYWYRVRALTTS
ncbi:GNAT family N-acetyltransferase [Paenibacillus urinalis]|uniref:GNAT family N-acetyltransferase n=1 Tax=Paenibacillus urinalis TaxID=521520 RepID=A0ABY7XEU0_9BACL|nr:GNAT family N-acetyltransferase [Paenibacillus urinalis]WDH99438.1 GNAT family N-acetyltransferase [Paenibacillus urinalis]WDI03072.1 GNAT family N-acetyltransferase [Paenibacillus urinalis]